MAAKTGLAAAEPARQTIAFSETSQTWTQVTMPDWARRVVISPQANPINVRVVSVSGLTEGQAFTTTVNHGSESVAGDAKYTIPLTGGRGNVPQCEVWVQCPTNPTVVEVSVEDNEDG